MSTDLYEKNIALLVEHFQEGCKANCIQKLGVEIEHFIVKKGSKEAVTYYEEHGIEDILRELSVNFSRKVIYAGKRMIGMYNTNYGISIEPAGQLEISIEPKCNISEIQYIYKGFLKLVMPILNKYDYELVTLGYHPKNKALELPLIPKKRYEFMNEYFKETGICGANMMRATASTQVSIDYCSEADFVLKYRVAYLLMPAFKLLTDNSPIFEGEPYQENLARTYVWNHVDDVRTGIMPGLFEDDFGFQSYAEYLWTLPLIFVPEDEEQTYVGKKSAMDLWSDKTLTTEELDHLLSMTFLDVRMKHYIEMRAADSLPFEYVLGYVALIKGIFFNHDILRTLECMFPVSAKDILHAQESVFRYGYQGQIYGMEAVEFIEQLLEFATEQLDFGEKAYLHPWKELVARKKTLAKGYYEKNNRSNEI